jgi:hypothetical protein
MTYIVYVEVPHVYDVEIEADTHDEALALAVDRDNLDYADQVEVLYDQAFATHADEEM